MKTPRTSDEDNDGRWAVAKTLPKNLIADPPCKVSNDTGFGGTCPLASNMKSTRHVKRRLKSVRKLKNSGVITVDYVHTSNNLADQFTKGLSRNVIESASREMGMRPM
jgi:hypothetical protein